LRKNVDDTVLMQTSLRFPGHPKENAELGKIVYKMNFSLIYLQALPKLYITLQACRFSSLNRLVALSSMTAVEEGSSE
jgi:hypothetical protein